MSPDLTCDHCGGDADSTLGGEHIWKCSEVTPNGDLQELVEELNERAHDATMDGDVAKATAYYSAANMIESQIESETEHRPPGDQ